MFTTVDNARRYNLVYKNEIGLFANCSFTEMFIQTNDPDVERFVQTVHDDFYKNVDLRRAYNTQNADWSKSITSPGIPDIYLTESNQYRPSTPTSSERFHTPPTTPYIAPTSPPYGSLRIPPLNLSPPRGVNTHQQHVSTNNSNKSNFIFDGNRPFRYALPVSGTEEPKTKRAKHNITVGTKRKRDRYY